MAKKEDTTPIEEPPKTKVEKLSAADSHLLPEVAKRIRTVNWKGGHRQVFGRFGTIDLTTLRVGRARRLIQQGFKKLREI